MGSKSKQEELSNDHGHFQCQGVPDQTYRMMQTDYQESTCLPDECSTTPSRQMSELTSGDALWSHKDQTVLQAALADCDVAAHVLDPSQPDFPIIAVSEGLSIMTEYLQPELVGKRCQLLSYKCNNDPAKIVHLRDARSKGASFETVLVNRKKSGQLFQVLLVLRYIAVRQDKTTGLDSGFLLGLQIELPNDVDDGDDGDDGDDHDCDDGVVTQVAPELIAQTKYTAEKLALHLSHLLQEDKESPRLHPSDSCPEKSSFLQVDDPGKRWFAQPGLGLAPLLMFKTAFWL